MGYRPDLFKHRRQNPTEKMRENAELDHGIYVGEVIVRPKDDTHSGRITVFIPMLAKDGKYEAYKRIHALNTEVTELKKLLATD